MAKMAANASFKLMAASGVAIVGLAAITLTGIAVVTGFKNTGLIDNTTADNFVVGLALFGTFSELIVLALLGKIIVDLFRKS